MVGAVHTFLLLCILHIEARVCDILTLTFKSLSDGRILGKHMVLMVSDPLNVCISSLVVHLACAIFVLLQVHLVPVHHRTIFITSTLDLVGEFRMLLCDPDLFL